VDFRCAGGSCLGPLVSTADSVLEEIGVMAQIVIAADGRFAIV